ncbi:MAG: peptidoglycan editing factor PgeF [Proteobacteria bacterium]|nr:peptidoglycan editing factor PgeF [Pseudomonadota bacterium]MBU1711198.1 peptidoglycan editing factor PgeF [Pseudomonadota bacterium]
MPAEIIFNSGDIPHYTFPPFSQPGLFHGVFTRHGGVSCGPWSTLNVSYDVGDITEKVDSNRKKIKDFFDVSRLVSLRQVHGDQVFVFKKEISADLVFDGYDAIITNVSDVALMIQQADCQAVFLYDPRQTVIGLIHSGWRGSVLDIIGKTIRRMTEEFSVTPSDVIAGISPSLGPCCADFINHQKELPGEFQEFHVGSNKFDFWAASKDQLQSAGIRPANIHIAGLCTVCSSNFFSYRRQAKTGRFASIIGMKP